MAKRSTRIEVTKLLNTGETVVTLNKTKMKMEMCEEIVGRLIKDWEDDGDAKNSDIKAIEFRCVG
jgi:vacuolar-type H+-ATPase subunit B/Vma2